VATAEEHFRPNEGRMRRSRVSGEALPGGPENRVSLVGPLEHDLRFSATSATLATTSFAEEKQE